MSNTATSAARGQEKEQTSSKFLTFFLSEEEYGLEILKVQEIIGVMDITPLPGTPPYLCGVINLRGKVIPVVNLRLKFDMEAVARTSETCIIVVKVNGVERGIVVDKVSEVADIKAAEIEEAPAFGTDISTDYILGIGKSAGRVKLLLDIDKVMAGTQADDVGAAAELVGAAAN
jgi:purine-binding chemotaxis protein CheW